MDQTAFLNGLLSGSMPLWAKAFFFIAPAMIALSIVIAFIRWGWEVVIGKSEIVENSPRDHARNIILFFLPLVLGVVYLWTISATFLTNEIPLSLKEIIIGGLFLGIMNTLFYRKFWKPYGAPKVKAILEKWRGTPEPPAPGASS